MAFDLSSLLNLFGQGAQVYGASQAAAAGRRTGNAQTDALNQMRSTTFNPFSVNGAGGIGGSYGPNGVNLSAGDLEGLRAALSQYGTGAVPGNTGLPQNVVDANTNLQGKIGSAGLDLGTLDTLSGGVNNQFATARDSLAGMTGGFQPGLQNTAFTGAGNQLGSLQQTFGQVYDNTLGNLRSQAKVTNDRAFSNLQNQQFGTGQLGTTGGGLQTEAFSRGLAQADAGYQLQAQQQAQSAQQNQLVLAQGLTGIGSGLSSQGDALLNSAFGRFASSAGLASDLSNQRFSRSMYGNETDYNRALTDVNTQSGLAGLPASLQGGQLQNVLAALNGTSNINSQAGNNYGLGLQSESANVNARLGVGSNLSNLLGNPQFGAPQQANASIWSQLGSRLVDQAGGGSNIIDQIKNLFGSTPEAQQIAASGASDTSATNAAIDQNISNMPAPNVDLGALMGGGAAVAGGLGALGGAAAAPAGTVAITEGAGAISSLFGGAGAAAGGAGLGAGSAAAGGAGGLAGASGGGAAALGGGASADAAAAGGAASGAGGAALAAAPFAIGAVIAALGMGASESRSRRHMEEARLRFQQFIKENPDVVKLDTQRQQQMYEAWYNARHGHAGNAGEPRNTSRV